MSSATLCDETSVHEHKHLCSKRQEINEDDVDRELEIEREDSPSHSLSPEPIDEDRTIVSFAPHDPENPHNWSSRRKAYIVFVGILTVINSTFGSVVTTGATTEISDYFHDYNEEQLVLPVAIYLIGYVLGPLAFGPLSENYGRQWVMIGTFALFTIFTLACAVAPNFASLIVFRLFVGIGASSPISVVGGVYADIYPDPLLRGRALTVFMVSTAFGPLLAVPAGGFIAVLSWRWIFWLSLILAGVTWPLLLFVPETHAATILRKRAVRLRKETGNIKIFAPIELGDHSAKQLITVVLTRPIRMICFEAIVSCACLYLSLVYAVFYMLIEAYPIIYVDIYGFNAGEEGLTLLPIGIGATFACAIYLYWERIFRLANARPTPSPWSQSEEYRRLPLACLGGPLFVISLFWIGWTALADVHWIVPTLAAIPFGMGFQLLFMALLNYLVDAYEVFAASAVAASSCSRSLAGAVLPFAARPMYLRLGVPWACSLLAFVSLGMCVIPFAFIKYGDRIRERSKFCNYLKQMKAEEEEKRRRESEREGSVVLESGMPEKMA